MDDDRQQAFMTALVTEHFVLQGARGQTTGEMMGRAALYLATVSSTLIALGFVAPDRSAFVPFAAAVLPALLILGEFTFVRLVAASIEDLRYLYAIQQIRSYYRGLVPDGLTFFADITISNPRVAATQAMGMSPSSLNVVFTVGGMIAAINSILAGVGIALILSDAGSRDRHRRQLRRHHRSGHLRAAPAVGAQPLRRRSGRAGRNHRRLTRPASTLSPPPRVHLGPVNNPGTLARPIAAETLNNEISTDVIEDGEFKQAMKNWSACMARHGFSSADANTFAQQAQIGLGQRPAPGQNPNGPPGPPTAAQNQAQIAMAVADANCTLTSDLAGIYFAVQANYEQQFVSANQQALNAAVRQYKAAFAKALKTLPALLRTTSATPNLPGPPPPGHHGEHHSTAKPSPSHS